MIDPEYLLSHPITPEYLHTPYNLVPGNKLSISRQLLEENESVYLFYIEKEDVDYSDVCKIIEDIQSVRKRNFPKFKL